MESMKNLKEQGEYEKERYNKKVQEICEYSKKLIGEMREKINKLDNLEDKNEILSLLEKVEKSYTEPSFINDMVELDRLKLGRQQPKKFYDLI